jgi:hypothetical protein
MRDEIDPNSIPDFEMKPATYQVWLWRYDDLDNIIDDEFVMEFDTPAEAIARARDLVDNESELNPYFNDSTAYIQVEVETTVEFEDHVENVGSLFNEFVKNPQFS